MNRKSQRGVRPQDHVVSMAKEIDALHDLVDRNWCGANGDLSLSLDQARDQLSTLRCLHPELDYVWRLVSAAHDLQLTNLYVRNARAHEQKECREAAARPPQNRCWDEASQEQYAQMGDEGPESFSDLLKERVRRNLMCRAAEVLRRFSNRLGFWSQFRRFGKVKPLEQLSDIARVGKRIRRHHHDTESLAVRNDLYGRVLELVASGKCPDPVAFAAEALKVEDIEFPRGCHRSHDD